MRPKKHRYMVCGTFILLAVLVVKGIDAKTHFLLNASTGLLEQTIKVIPNSEYAHSLLSWAYYKLDDPERADAAFDRAHINSIKKTIRANPDDADAHFYLGQKLHHKGRFDQAIACYIKAKQLNSDNIGLWESLGQAYIDNEQYDKAVDTYKEGIDILDDHPVWSTDNRNLLNCYLGLEFAYTKLQRTEKALACREKALQLWPNTADYYFCFGNLFLQTGDWANAIELYKSSLELEPNNPDTQHSLDTAYHELSQQENEAGSTAKTTFVLEKELHEITAQIEKERQRIQEEYAVDYAKFSAWAEKRIRELDREQKIAYEVFQQQRKERKSAADQGDPNNHEMHDQSDPAYNTMPGVLGRPAGQYELAMAQIEKERDFIYQEFSRLRDTRDRELRGLADYERNAKDRILSEMRRVKRLHNKETVNHIGIIQSISIGTDKGNRVMLGGEFYSEGDTINGCRIISIHENGVKYAKEGSVYRQGLN